MNELYVTVGFNRTFYMFIMYLDRTDSPTPLMVFLLYNVFPSTCVSVFVCLCVCVMVDVIVGYAGRRP